MGWQTLVKDIRSCQLCQQHLAAGVNPVIQLHPNAPILLAGQAPGRKVHQSGVPFDDASGERLRDWLGVNRAQFYDAKQFAIVPMAFCYPGKGNNGDFPPRPECAANWREQVLQQLPKLQLTLAIGQYAQQWHLARAGHSTQGSLTERVKNWRHYYADGILPLPHPSPRNNLWLQRNPWFAAEVLPELRRCVARL